jgi:hypothetical protein
MNKSVILMTSTALLAGPLFALHALAQNEPTPQQRAAPTVSQPADQGDSRTVRMKARLADEADARIARIKVRLRLTPDQEKNWSGVESELRDLAKKRADRLIAQRTERAKDTERTGLIDYWHRAADLLSERSANLKASADAAHHFTQAWMTVRRSVSMNW